MQTGKYTLDEINIGDQVTFYSTPQQSNYDELWEVIGIGKDNGKLQIKTRDGFIPEEYWEIDISNVVTCLPAHRE